MDRSRSSIVSLSRSLEEKSGLVSADVSSYHLARTFYDAFLAYRICAITVISVSGFSLVHVLPLEYIRRTNVPDEDQRVDRFGAALCL